MGVLRSSVAFTVTALASVACGSLLGIDQDYVEVSDGGVADASSDEAAAGDGAVSCAGHVCDGVCLEGTDCSSCASGKLFCAASHVCVGSCSGCANRVECWSCPPSSSPRGSCEPTSGAYCLGSDYPRCGCATTDACPGSLNICISGKCETCGAEGVTTDGRKCKGGTECAAERSVCKN